MFKRFGLERFLMNEGGGDGGIAGGSGGGANSGNTQVPGGASASTPPVGNDWTSGLNDDFKNYATTKGFKDPSAVLDSYRNLEKLIGKRESLLTLPEKDDDKAGWDSVYNRLGRPADPKEYKFELSPEAATPEFNDFIRNAFHELGITKKQGETLMTKYGEFFGQQVEKTQGDMQSQTDTQVKSLQKEWGKAFDQNMSTAKSAANAFGFDAQKIDALEAALGYDGVMKFMHDLGTKIGPHQFVNGNRGTGNQAYTPSQAQSRIAELRADPAFTKRYVSGDVEARQEMSRLHEYAYPTEIV